MQPPDDPHPPRPPRPPRARLVLALAGGVALVLPALVAGLADGQVQPPTGARILVQVMDRVGRFAVDSVPTAELYERAARGLVEQLGDPYADLFSPDELASFSRETIGNDYGGLGVQIEDQLGAITVTQVFPRSPAEEGGVVPGDRILRVDTTDVAGRALDHVSSLLLGPAGTPVTVTFARAGVEQPITGRFTRADVHVPAVPFAIVLEGGVGYVPLQRFNSTAAAEVAGALARLGREGARSFVLDVRGNTGGDVGQSLAVSELFLDTGQELASLRWRGDSVERYVARRPALVPDAPVVVLTDEATASASEIVAGALQDHARAIVVGQPSFGKGLVQSLYPLDGGWALKLTTGKWYTPAGRSIQRERLADGRPAGGGAGAGSAVAGAADGGITPDVAVRPDTLSTADREFLRTVAPKGAAAYSAIYDLARQQRGRVTPDFVVAPAWRDSLHHRLVTAGVEFRPGQFESARGVVDRLLEQRVASLAFGDSAAFRRSTAHDAQLRQAVALLRAAPSQRALVTGVGDRG